MCVSTKFSKHELIFYSKRQPFGYIEDNNWNRLKFKTNLKLISIVIFFLPSFERQIGFFLIYRY